MFGLFRKKKKEIDKAEVMKSIEGLVSIGTFKIKHGQIITAKEIVLNYLSNFSKYMAMEDEEVKLCYLAGAKQLVAVFEKSVYQDPVYGLCFLIDKLKTRIAYEEA